MISSETLLDRPLDGGHNVRVIRYDGRGYYASIWTPDGIVSDTTIGSLEAVREWLRSVWPAAYQAAREVLV